MDMIKSILHLFQGSNGIKKERKIHDDIIKRRAKAYEELARH